MKSLCCLKTWEFRKVGTYCLLTVMIPHVCVCSHPDGGPGYCSDCVWLPSLHLSAQVSRLPIQVHVLAGSTDATCICFCYTIV